MPKNQVANVLLAHQAKGGGMDISRTARGIARTAARELLGPLLETACARLCAVLRRAFDIAYERQQLLQGVPRTVTEAPAPGTWHRCDNSHMTDVITLQRLSSATVCCLQQVMATI